MHGASIAELAELDDEAGLAAAESFALSGQLRAETDEVVAICAKHDVLLRVLTQLESAGADLESLSITPETYRAQYAAKVFPPVPGGAPVADEQVSLDRRSTMTGDEDLAETVGAGAAVEDHDGPGIGAELDTGRVPP